MSQGWLPKQILVLLGGRKRLSFFFLLTQSLFLKKQFTIDLFSSLSQRKESETLYREANTGRLWNCRNAYAVHGFNPGTKGGQQYSAAQRFKCVLGCKHKSVEL